MAVAVRGLVGPALPRQPAPGCVLWNSDAGCCLVTRPAALELARTGPSPLARPRCREKNSAQAYLALALLGAQQPAFAPELCRWPR